LADLGNMLHEDCPELWHLSCLPSACFHQVCNLHEVSVCIFLPGLMCELLSHLSLAYWLTF
jgi:hypothetical protein